MAVWFYYKVCSGEKIVLFMDEYSVRSNISNPSCELVAFDRGQLINMGFTFVKHSPYRLRSYGVLQVLRKRYERGINDFEISYEIMPLAGTLPIFFILIVGILLSILIVAFENIYFYFYEDDNAKPINVVYLQSSEDYELYKRLTLLKKTNTFFSLLIFKSYNQTFMNLCENPRGNDFNLFFNTRMLVVCKYFDHRPVINVYEWYSLHPNETIIDHFAIWKNATLIISTKSNLWERRRSFKNITLKVTAVKSNARSNKNKRLHGLMASLLMTIAEVANFKIDIQEPEDFYGVQDLTTKKWNGVIGKLANNETDIGLGEFTPTKSRLEVTDFSDPVITSPLKYYIKKPDKHILHWSMYYKALGQTVGYVLISIILILPPIISYLELSRRNMHDSRKISNSYLNIFIDCYFDVFGILCKMPLNNNWTHYNPLSQFVVPDSSSLLSIYIWLHVLAYALFIIYSGILTSYLAVFIPYLPFNTMEEFLMDGRYKLAIIKNTSYLELLRDTDEKASGILLDENDLPTYSSQGIEMVCAEKIVLFMDHYSVTNNQTNPPCELMAFAQSLQVSMALAFTKNSPYVDYFNYYLRILNSRGLIQHLMKSFKRRSESVNMTYEPVRLYNALPIFLVLIKGMLFYEIMPLAGTLPIFFILIVGILLSILIVAFENIHLP
ncbi:hypothetical protein TSAR_006446 [Trichomalopsis sarcophagae]|uniref:Ionotropic glutamate receptor L-glutamate and glycine-binding domain-containing protein n=1 Tax=Trichomalopsis sarcophagae TaxID=543379 RepID=A0A232FGW1_9HYME|nr:hypothetical protein TSAR_006446 [Trichomalopsis sarcophagae]